MKKTKGHGATPKPSQSRKPNRSIEDRIYTRDDGALALCTLYVLQMLRAVDRAPLSGDACRLLQTLILHFANPNKGRDWWLPLAWPTMEDLMQRTDFGRTKLHGLFRELVRAGFVAIVCVDSRGEIIDKGRDADGRWLRTGAQGVWDRNGYAINLDALESVEDDPDALEKQRVTRAKRKAPCSQNERGPCSEFGDDHVRKTNTDHVRTTNTKGLKGTASEIADDHNRATIATATTTTPRNEDQDINTHSPERERSDPERCRDRAYPGPGSQNEHGSESGADTAYGYSPEAAASLAAAIADFDARKKQTADEFAAAQAQARDARDITPEDDAEL